METNELFYRLEADLNELIDTLNLFLEEEFNVSPFPGSWTAAQVGDHLYKSYGLPQLLAGRKVTADRSPEEKVEMLRSVFLNFSKKYNSPEFIIPSDQKIDKDFQIEALKAKKGEIMEAVKKHDLTLLCIDFVVPPFGEMTGLEWAYQIIFHTERHILQLKNILNKIQTNKKQSVL